MSGATLRTPVPGSTYERGSAARTVRGAPALVAALTAVALVACGPSVPPTGPSARAPAPELPPIPDVDGSLDLRVSYPRDSLRIATRDRNFIFGSAGSGAARVWVNGREVEVQPNGGFLAFLPVPEDSVYRLRATLAGETMTLDVPVLLPPAPPEPGDSAVIVTESVYPSGAWVALPGERIEVGFTGTGGGEAWLELGDDRAPLAPVPVERGGATDFEVSPGPETDGHPGRTGAPTDTERLAAGRADDGDGLATYRGFFAARRIVAVDTGVAWPGLTGERRPAGAPEGSVSAAIVLAARGDTARMHLPLNLVLADPDRPRVGVGLDLRPASRNGDGRVVGRPGSGGGPYDWFWANGVELELTGERYGAYRVRLTDDLSAWTPTDQVQLRRPGIPPPASGVGVVRLDPRPGYVDVRIALDRRLPYRVEEGERSVALIVYGATSRVNFLQHGRVDRYIDRAEWSQPADGVFRVDVGLTAMPWGYDVFWQRGDLVLRLRRPPTIDPGDVLRGLTIGVDAGHGGADTLTMGPTGLTEADANLGVARALRDELRRRGARVVMSRSANTTVSTVERTRLARREGVDVWVSVHNNAFPDGVEPWSNSGTSVYYNHPRAAGLARSVQRALLGELGLRDLGIGRADLHQPRFTWAPAILTETLFMMIPAHEAFLKTEDGRRRVARAHVRGLEAWLRQAVDPTGTPQTPRR